VAKLTYLARLTLGLIGLSKWCSTHSSMVGFSGEAPQRRIWLWRWVQLQ